MDDILTCIITLKLSDEDLFYGLCRVLIRKSYLTNKNFHYTLDNTLDGRGGGK